MSRRRRHLNQIKFTLPESITIYEDYPKITNYVATVNFGIQFDLHRNYLYLSNTGGKPRRFAANTIRSGDTTGLLFPNGKMVIGGAKTKNGAILAGHTYRLFIEKIAQPFYDRERNAFYYAKPEKHIQFKEFEVQNIVGSGKLFNVDVTSSNAIHFAENTGIVDLDSFARNNIVSAGWDKDIFPGMRLCIESSSECPLQINSIMAHVFEGSNNVLMGARVKKDLYIGHNYLKKVIAPYLQTLENKQETLSRKTQIVEGAFKSANLFQSESTKKRKIQSIDDDPQAQQPSNKKARTEPERNSRKRVDEEEEESPYDKYMNEMFDKFRKGESEKIQQASEYDVLMEINNEFTFF